LTECMMAVLAGKSTVSGSTITFMKRNGTTGRIQVTVGSKAGERTASTILP
jgi:hypothetical protein